MGRAGQHGHFARGFAGPDDADELGRMPLLVAEDPETARAQQIQDVGRVAGIEQGFAAGQGEPAGVGIAAATEDAVKGVFQPVGSHGSHADS